VCVPNKESIIPNEKFRSGLLYPQRQEIIYLKSVYAWQFNHSLVGRGYDDFSSKAGGMERIKMTLFPCLKFLKKIKV